MVPERFEHIGSNLPVPEPGLGLNPDPLAQQKHLQKAYELHMKEQKEMAILSKTLQGKSPPVVTTGEPLPEYHSEEDEPVEEGSKVVVVKRITKTKRNKQKRKKIRDEEEDKKKVRKSVNKQLQQLPTILSSIEEEEAERTQAQQEIKELKEKNPTKKLRLGKNLFQLDFPQMVLTEEIQGGHFRKMKPSYGVVKDQFKRFQERNLIEPRNKNRFKRRYPLKTYTPKS